MTQTMNQEEATNQLQRELHKYLSLTNEQQKMAYWERIRQEAATRTAEDKALLVQAIAEDVEQIKQRVLNLKTRIDEATTVAKT